MAEVSVLLSDGLSELYRQCRRETGYCLTHLLDLLEQYDGVEAAHRILQSEPSPDFEHLCELRRPDLTVEAYILTLDWKEQIFSEEELNGARARVAFGDAQVRSRRIAER